MVLTIGHVGLQTHWMDEAPSDAASHWMAEEALLPQLPAGGDADGGGAASAVRPPQVHAAGGRRQQMQAIRQIQAALQPHASHSAAVSGALTQLQRCAGAEEVVAAYCERCAASAVPAASACAVSATCTSTSVGGGRPSARGEAEDALVCGASPPPRWPRSAGSDLTDEEQEAAAAEAAAAEAAAAAEEAVTLRRRALTSAVRWHPLPTPASAAAAAPAPPPAAAAAPRRDRVLLPSDLRSTRSDLPCDLASTCNLPSDLGGAVVAWHEADLVPHLAADLEADLAGVIARAEAALRGLRGEGRRGEAGVAAAPASRVAAAVAAEAAAAEAAAAASEAVPTA